MIGNWTVQLEDGVHSITADLSGITGKLTISWDGYPIDVSIHWKFGGDIRTFERYGHTFVLRVKKLSYFGNGKLALLMDGGELPPGNVVVAQHKFPLLSLQFVEERNIVETEEVVSVEDYPLDNSFGTDQLTSERQVSKESTNELIIEDTNQLSGKLGLGLFSVLQTEAAAQLSKKTGTRVGQKITESQTMRFTVSAGKAVMYRVVWKRKVRTGELLYRTDSNSLKVPYRLNYGLSFEVQTIERK